ncbi:DUF2332 domain-containing protein [Hoeflea prorocentri]|uniref:DUF2332 family protein n=1 Tax=Hoeflea prorocentri TaxID=1922333 RepID=A0A9X3UGN9_9HYPH|nr:DUF2332 family protein [Hoeflea prorocentri]MCY6380289.1 DUF2332 family protein [Hoeflea prorocentri]MDA5398089.1 DUF2332 family protein [Hoeflea prorocentri]
MTEAFLRQEKACDHLGSPFTAQICRTIAQFGLPQSRLLEMLRSWRGDPTADGDAVPVRLCAALHERVIGNCEPALSNIYPPAHEGLEDAVLHSEVLQAVERHDDWLCARMAFAPQTNEIRRSTAVIAALSHIASKTGLPITLSELGASAGLNLLLDRYAHRIDGKDLGDPGSPVQLKPQWSGNPAPKGPVSIAERRGCDLAPFDLSDPEHRTRLLSYVWADQSDRFERLRAALQLHDRFPVLVDKAHMLEWLPTRLADAPHGHAHVIFHTIAWQYLPEQERRAGRDLIDAAGARCTDQTPLFLLGLEGDGDKPGAALTLTSWPGRQTMLLARVDFHGRWINWKAAS